METLEIDELDRLFESLREDSAVSLPDALQEVIARAKHKGMDAGQLQKALTAYGIQATPKFDLWLKAQFR